MFRIGFFSLCLVFVANSVAAKSHKIILSVSSRAAVVPEIQLDDEQFDKIPQISMTVQTPWYQTPQTFEGPLLRDILKLAEIKDGDIKLIALNEYTIKFPVSDAFKYDVILARKRNGKIMTVRDKGPLFLIYPFHQHAELIKPEYFRRSSWQLNSIRAE
ncbi:MAG: hypothetical protein NT086_18630 [Proteobacteria bacterium]|nr:hypothetical protein [Pseudomonadota bacterium]